jgi:hypothetical protein
MMGKHIFNGAAPDLLPVGRRYNKTSMAQIMECIDGGMSVARTAEVLYINPNHLRVLLSLLDISAHGCTGRGANKKTLEEIRRTK